jgi:hypothetical protein
MHINSQISLSFKGLITLLILNILIVSKYELSKYINIFPKQKLTHIQKDRNNQ